METAQENPTYFDRARGDGVRVLLAEDNAALRRLLAALLRNANGVSIIVEAEDGASAVARAVHTHPHLAVFDNHIPRLRHRRRSPTEEAAAGFALELRGGGAGRWPR